MFSVAIFVFVSVSLPGSRCLTSDFPSPCSSCRCVVVVHSLRTRATTTAQRHEGHKEGQSARSSASRGAREGARVEENLDVGAPLWVPRPFLDCGKKGFLASARGTRSHDAAGQHRRLANEARLVRSTLPPSPGPPVDTAGPIRHPNRRFYRPARVSRENTRDQRRARPGRRNLCH